MPAYSASYWPEYKSLVSGIDDTNVYDTYYRRRGLRALSALPDLCRDRSLVIPDQVQRSLSVAREIINDEPPPKSSYEYTQYWDTKDVIDRSQKMLDRIDNYWLTRAKNATNYPEANTYVTTGGKVYKILAPSRRRFPSQYWSSYPYSSTLPPLYSYGRKYWSYYDPVYDNYVRSDLGSPYERSPYYRSSYYSSPRLSWKIDYPYTSLMYRPSYAKYSRLRDISMTPSSYRRVYY